ncbi:MAG: NADP-dependent oxidoreductase [Steroidobacteraceae bacterium]
MRTARTANGGRRTAGGQTCVAAALALAFAVAAPACAGAPVPDDMLAVRMTATGGPEVLKLERVAVPAPGAGEVRIRVRAAGVNPVDWKIRESGYGRKFDAAAPRIPGFDVSGTIDAVGEGVTMWRRGDAVIAALQRSAQGGYAEYAVASAGDVAPKPAAWTFEAAAGLPTVGITVWRYLVLTGAVARGERVLVQGGAGGVGSIAVQVAKGRGAHVIATTSARNRAYLESIGADEVIDYRAAPFEDRVAGVDLVFDTVGGDTLARSIAVVRHGGRLVSIAGRPDGRACDAAGITCAGAIAAQGPFGDDLRAIVALADAGELTLHVDRVFPLGQAAEAQELNRQGRTRGKIVLQVRP